MFTVTARLRRFPAARDAQHGAESGEVPPDRA